MLPEVYKPSEFVALVNQTLEFAYPYITIEGEVSEFTVSKGKWVYFKLKDERSQVKFFGSVYQLNTQIEDGMIVKVSGSPRLHEQYGFSVTFQNIQPSGEGSIKRAYELLKAKLLNEGLFDDARKRFINPYPEKIGLVTSSESAAYKDFMKIVNERWHGLDIYLVDVAVQGESAPAQIITALKHLNELDAVLDMIVVTRGGGSLDDLSAFNDENLVRAVASSRVPTIVAIGHERDLSLCELVADKRAATPTNAAQIAVPDRKNILDNISRKDSGLRQSISETIYSTQHKIFYNLTFIEKYFFRSLETVNQKQRIIYDGQVNIINSSSEKITQLSRSLKLSNPKNILKRGYALARDNKGRIISSSKNIRIGDNIGVELGEGNLALEVKDVK